MSNELGDLPPVEVVTPGGPVSIDAIKDANSTATPSQANAITAISGLSGAGKSELANTSAEYCWEKFGGITLCYAPDPGGFGSNRLALIRAGIMRVWDPRNHVNYFETMELATLGGWPEKILDPETGYADPNVRIIMPRRIAYAMICPQGHVAKVFDNEAVLNASAIPCAECGVVTNLSNALRVDRSIVRHKMFRNVKGRIYDSISAMSDHGLLLEIPNDSATNRLPVTSSGGRLLGSADALKSGSMTFGSGSEAQVGFMQNRVYGWLMNIRKIPDQAVPTVCTFGLEESKADDESGGVKVLGMRLAGKARTSASAGWVGHLLYAAHEPKSMDPADANKMVFRLWLTNHYDPRDMRKLTILAKHRGSPIGMPDCLEDPWDPDPAVRAKNAWTQCSLKTFYNLLEKQLVVIETDLRKKYPNAPGYVDEQADEDGDDVIGTLASKTVSAAQLFGTGAVNPVTGAQPVARAASGRVRRAAPAVMAASASGTPAPAPVPPGAVVAAQLSGPAAVPVPVDVPTPAASEPVASSPAVPAAATPPAAAEPPAPTITTPAATVANPAAPAPARIRRIPRPPVS